MSRTWQRFRGAPADDRQSRWWAERESGASSRDPDAVRPEAEAVPSQPAGPGARPRRRARAERPEPATPPVTEQRRGLPVGASGRPSTTAGFTGRSDQGEVDDRSIYRRPDSPRRGGDPVPVQPELVDGVPVYKIYRPRAARAADGSTWSRRAD
jgi:hypothetical protein